MVVRKDKRKKKKESKVAPIAVNISIGSRRAPRRAPEEDRMKVANQLMVSARNLEAFHRFGRGNDLTLQAGFKNLENEQQNLIRKNKELDTLLGGAREDLSKLDQQVALLGKFNTVRGEYPLEKIRWAMYNYPNIDTVEEAIKFLKEAEKEGATPWDPEVSSTASESLTGRRLERHRRAMEEQMRSDPRRASIGTFSLSSSSIPLDEGVSELQEEVAGEEMVIPEEEAGSSIVPPKKRGRPKKTIG